jgi:hypothetical protein
VPWDALFLRTDISIILFKLLFGLIVGASDNILLTFDRRAYVEVGVFLRFLGCGAPTEVSFRRRKNSWNRFKNHLVACFVGLNHRRFSQSSSGASDSDEFCLVGFAPAILSPLGHKRDAIPEGSPPEQGNISLQANGCQHLFPSAKLKLRGIILISRYPISRTSEYEPGDRPK